MNQTQSTIQSSSNKLTNDEINQSDSSSKKKINKKVLIKIDDVSTHIFQLNNNASKQP